MWKKRILCLVLVLCAALAMTACQQKETFPTSVQPETQVTEVPQDQQNIFGETPLPQSIDFDDGSYNPASEEGGDSEDLLALIAEADREGTTEMPIIQSEYAGATPVLIDPVDKPTPTPLPPLTFNYTTYEAKSLHLSFEAPANWTIDDTQTDTYILTNPDPSMDYAAQLSIRLVPVNKNYNKNELIKEVKNTLDTLGSSGFSKFERTNTAGRKFMNTDAVYANYTATTKETATTKAGVKIAGRMIIACANKTLYILHVSYPQGYTKTYVDNVYDKFRHSVKTLSN